MVKGVHAILYPGHVEINLRAGKQYDYYKGKKRLDNNVTDRPAYSVNVGHSAHNSFSFLTHPLISYDARQPLPDLTMRLIIVIFFFFITSFLLIVSRCTFFTTIIFLKFAPTVDPTHGADKYSFHFLTILIGRASMALRWLSFCSNCPTALSVFIVE